MSKEVESLHCIHFSFLRFDDDAFISFDVSSIALTKTQMKCIFPAHEGSLLPPGSVSSILHS